MSGRSPSLRERISPGWVLRAFLASRGSIQAPLGKDWLPALASLRETRRRTPLLISDAAGLQIQICVRAARALGGVMAEAGVLQGGSARLICEAKGATPLHLFDVFETLQAPSPECGAGQAVRRHFRGVHGDQAKVAELLAGYPNVTLHPGLFPATAASVAQARFAFVHLDLDLIAPMREGLAFFHPRLLPGGILIGDDCQDPAVRAVFTDYFADRADTVIDLPWGQVMVVKQGVAEAVASIHAPRETAARRVPTDA